jgi:hypothetical protein
MSQSDQAIAWEMSARLRELPACHGCKRPVDNPHDLSTKKYWTAPVMCHACLIGGLEAYQREKRREQAGLDRDLG